MALTYMNGGWREFVPGAEELFFAHWSARNQLLVAAYRLGLAVGGSACQKRIACDRGQQRREPQDHARQSKLDQVPPLNKKPEGGFLSKRRNAGQYLASRRVRQTTDLPVSVTV
jgi:hypothetical protein